MLQQDMIEYILCVPSPVGGARAAVNSPLEEEGVITATSTSLLVGLKDHPADQAWSQFCERYRPVLTAFARRLGLSEHDAEDAAQETLVAFLEAYRRGEYDRDKGRLRNWLLGIAKNKVRYLQRQKGRDLVIVAGDDQSGVMTKIADDQSISELWEAEWRRAVIKVCLAQVRSQVEASTMQAFELLTLSERPAEEVASQLGMTVNAILKAKRRVLARMREIYRALEANW